MDKILQLINDSAIILNKSGNSYVAYITSELQPFSNQQRPDLIYSPHNAEVTYFIEYGCLRDNTLGVSYINSIEDRIKFVIDGLPEKNVKYVIAVDELLENEEKITIGSFGIDIIENINSAEILAKRLQEMG